MWNADPDAFVEGLVEFAVQKAGCVHPTESTIQKIVVLSLLKSGNRNLAVAMKWENKRAFVDVVKGMVKKPAANYHRSTYWSI